MKEKEQYFIVPYIVAVTEHPVLIKIKGDVENRTGVGVIWAKPSDNIFPGRPWSLLRPLHNARTVGPFTSLKEAKIVFLAYLL